MGTDPVHAPAQLLNTCPAAGVAVSVTAVLAAKLAVHTLPQLIPDGLEATVPVPDTVTLKSKLLPVKGAKVATAEVARSNLTLHVLTAPAQAPDQPEKLCPATGVAVRVNTVSAAKSALQLAAQLMPDGCDATVPVPLIVKLKVKVD